jgi:predicted nucleotidyltransferase component of viral defense system
MYYNTVSELLKSTINKLMGASIFESFRLVGGTALSLQLGHRISVDIDLFSDLPYGNIDFKAIDEFIDRSFPYSSHFSNINSAIGKSYLIGPNIIDVVKLDVYYSDNFIQPVVIRDNIRMASIEEIIAMKMDVIQRVGRKKDFWDLHELAKNHEISTMIKLHKQRYPYNHDENLLLENLVNFTNADDDFDPICLRGNYWEFIKEDIIEAVENYKST